MSTSLENLSKQIQYLCNLVENLQEDNQQLKHQLENMAMQQPGDFLSKNEAAALLCVHPQTLMAWKTEFLIEGIHFTTTPGGDVRFCRAMLSDWFLNRNNPSAHQLAIEAHLEQRPKPNKKKRLRLTA